MSDEPWGGFVFNEDERRLFLFLMGMEPPEANPGQIFGLAQAPEDLAAELEGLAALIEDTLAKVDGALPDEVIAQYKAMLRELMGSNGYGSHIDEIRDGALAAATQFGSWARSLGQAQIQIVSTLIAMQIQLAIMSAMAFFTGGASLGEEAVAYNTARLSLTMILQRLAGLIEFIVPTAIQAAIGALIMMAASLISTALGYGDPNKPINWTWVAEGAVGGALADLGIRGTGAGLSGLGKWFDGLVGDNFKKYLDTNIVTELKNIGGDFVKMGVGSGIAGTLAPGLVEGYWHFDPMMIVGGGIGGALFGSITRGVHLGAGGYSMKKIGGGVSELIAEERLGDPPPEPRPGDEFGPGGPGGGRPAPVPESSLEVPPPQNLRPAPASRPTSVEPPERIGTVGENDPILRPGLEDPLTVNGSHGSERFGEVPIPSASRNLPQSVDPALSESPLPIGENRASLPPPVPTPVSEHTPITTPPVRPEPPAPNPARSPRLTPLPENVESRPDPVSPVESLAPRSDLTSPAEPLASRNLTTPEPDVQVPSHNEAPPSRPQTTSTTPPGTPPRSEPDPRATESPASVRNAPPGDVGAEPETVRPNETTTRTGDSGASAEPSAEPLTKPPAESSAGPVRTESGSSPASGERAAGPQAGRGPGTSTSTGPRPESQTPSTPVRTETGSTPKAAGPGERPQDPPPATGRDRPVRDTPEPAPQGRVDRRATEQDVPDEGEPLTTPREANTPATEAPPAPVRTESTSAEPARHDGAAQDPPPAPEREHLISDDPPPAGHRPDDVLVDLEALGREDVTPNFGFEPDDPAATERLHTGEAELRERYAGRPEDDDPRSTGRPVEENGRRFGRLQEENRRYRQQWVADDQVDAAIAAYHRSNTHGVPDRGANADPGIRLREARFPDDLTRPVTEAYRAALAEDERARAKPPQRVLGGQVLADKPPTLQQRLTAKLETVFETHDYSGSPHEVAELLLRRDQASEPEGWARKAGVPDDLVEAVAEGYRTARAEHHRAQDQEDEVRPFEEHLADVLESRLGGSDHGLNIPAVADRLLREQARLDADRTRPWTFEVRDRFDARWKPEFDRYVKGEITREQFQQRFDDLVEGLHDQLELEVAVSSVRMSAEEDFDAVATDARYSPAEEARLRARFLAETEADVRRIAERLGINGERVDEGPAQFLSVPEAAQRLRIGLAEMEGLLDGGKVRSVTTGATRRVPVDALAEHVRGDGPAQRLTVNEAARRLRIERAQMDRLLARGEVRSVRSGRARRVTTEALADYVGRPRESGPGVWDLLHTEADARAVELSRGLPTRLELEHEADLHFRRTAEAAGLDPASEQVRDLRTQYGAEFEARTWTLPDGRETRTVEYADFERQAAEFEPALRDLDERWTARLHARMIEDALVDRAQEEVGDHEMYWREMSERPRAERDGVDYEAVIEGFRADLRAESSRLLGGRPPAELTARDWENHVQELTAAHERLAEQLPARLDEQAGLSAMLRRVDQALEGTGRPEQHVERVRADAHTTLTDAYRSVVGRPEEGVWSGDELTSREEAFYRDHFLPYRASLNDRLRFEATVEQKLGEAGRWFTELTAEVSELTGRAQRRYTMTEETFEAVSNDARADWAKLQHEVMGPRDRDVAKWLELERSGGDAFGTAHRESWEQFQKEADAPRLARLREQAAVENAQARERLLTIYRDLIARSEAREALDRTFQEERPDLRSPNALADYRTGEESLRTRLRAEMEAAATEETRAAVLAEARAGLAALREQVDAKEQVYRDWSRNPEWTLDFRQLELTRTPLAEWERRAGLGPEPARPEPVPAVSEGPVGRRAYAEDVPDEANVPVEHLEQAQILLQEAPLEEAPPEVRETPAAPRPARLVVAEARAAEGLARLRAEVEQRDQAHLAFDAVLDEQPDRGFMFGALEQVDSAREWFVQQWTTTEPESRSGLETELTRRLDEARAVADARDAFAREVVFSGPRMRTVDLAFHHSPQATALRDEFVQAMTDGPAPTEDVRTGLVQDFRGRYDGAARAWRRQFLADQASEAAPPAQDPQNAANLDGAEGRRDDAVPEPPVRTVTTGRPPDPEWTPETASWYRQEQAALARRITDFVAGRTLDASTQARLASDHARQLDALREIAERRDVAQREFTEFLSGQSDGQVTLRSGATATWVRRHLDDLRRRVDDLGTPYIDEHLAATVAPETEERGWTPVVEPSYAKPGDWRTPAWHAAETRLYETLEATFARHDAEAAVRTATAADRQAFDEVFESWAPEGARETAGGYLDAVRDRAWKEFDRRILAGDQERQEILDGLPDELDRQAARQVALQVGRDAYERAFQSWYEDRGRRLGDADEALPVVLTDTVAESVRGGERAGFEREWETVVDEFLDGVSDLRAALPRIMPDVQRAAGHRLGELTGDDLWQAFDRRAGHASEQERFTELVSSTAETFRGNLPEPDRDLLGAFAAEDAVPSGPGREQVRSDGWRELDTAYEEIFPPGAEVTAEMRQQWKTRFDAVAASLPSRLARQTAREGALTRTLADVNTAIEAWRTAPPETLEEFRQRFGVEFGGGLPGGVRRSLEQSIARSVNDRFGELFTGERNGTPAERLEQWQSWYGETTGTPRLHALFARETARQGVAAKSGEVFAAAYTEWRQGHPEPALSGDDLARARTGLTERMMAAYEEVFGGAIDKPEDLAERAALWDQRVERLTSELPAHLAFEATVPAALRTAGRSFQTVGEGHDLDDTEWVNETAESFREEFFDEWRLWWAPLDRATMSSEEESTADLFETGRAEAIAEARSTIGTDTDTESIFSTESTVSTETAVSTETDIVPFVPKDAAGPVTRLTSSDHEDSSWSPFRLGPEGTRQAFPWLSKINPLVVEGGDFLTNCLLIAIAIHLTLEEARLSPDEDPELLAWFQVPPDVRSPYEYLANLEKGDPIDVPGFRAIEDAVLAAGYGAHGVVVIGAHGTDVDHIVTAVNRKGRVVFLDGQRRGEADLPDDFRSLQFLPTSEGFPRELVAVRPEPWPHGRLLGADPGVGPSDGQAQIQDPAAGTNPTGLTSVETPAEEPDIVDRWLQESALDNKPRSSALQDLDAAVARLRGNRDDVRAMRAVLHAIDEWRTPKNGPSGRDAAVARLQATVEADLTRLQSLTEAGGPEPVEPDLGAAFSDRDPEEAQVALRDLEARFFPPELSLGVEHRADTIVTPHVDGDGYFGAIAKVLDTLHGPGDRLYINSWYLNLATRLRTGAGEPNLGERLVALAEAGVDVRVVVAIPRHSLGSSGAPPLQQDLLRMPYATMVGGFARTNLYSVESLRSAGAEGRHPLADRVLIDWGGGFDSRHEKTTVAYSATTGQLHAFVGGMDYAPNRFTEERHAGAPQHNYTHDAGVQLQGRAAEEVLRNFWTRWDEAATLPARSYWSNGQKEPYNAAVSPKPESLTPEYSPTLVRTSSRAYADAGVRIWRSYAPHRVTPLGDTLRLDWHTLPAGGVSEVSDGLTAAINAARTYIYVEDQTLNPSHVGNVYNKHEVLFPAVSRALARGVKVIFVTQGFPGRGAKSSADATPKVSGEIDAFVLRGLTPEQRANFALFTLRDTKVHSKILLVDDEFASIGSANFWDRSMVGDESEVTAAMVHPGGPRSLVADLRVRLWREHLRLPETESADTDLRDLSVGLGYFRRTWGTGTASDIPDSVLQEVRDQGLVSRLMGRAGPADQGMGIASVPRPEESGVDPVRSLPDRLEQGLTGMGVDRRVHALSTGNLIRLVQTPDMWGAPMAKDDVSAFGDRAIDELAGTVRGIIGSGTRLIDVVSLLPPTGRIHEAVKDALLDVASREGSGPVLVRFLFGNVPLRDTFSEFVKDLRGFLKDNGVPMDRMTVLAGQLSNVLRGFWNHSKIVAADGAVALVGGHNLWAETYGGYPPVHDVSVEMIGEGARHAQDFADYLWTSGGGDLKVEQITVDYRAKTLSPGPARNKIALVDPAELPHTEPDLSRGAPEQWHSGRALSLGRAAFLGDQASDTAKEAVIKNARHSLKISQQDLAFTGFTAEKDHQVARWIAEALVDKPELTVDIVVSSAKAGAVNGAYSWGFGAPGTYAMIKRFVRTVADPEARGDRDELIESALRRVKVAPFVFTDRDGSERGFAWPDPPAGTIARRYEPGSKFAMSKKTVPEPANHAKVYIADDAVYYVGSDNLYPHKLAEFGYLIEGEAVQDLVTNYWDKLWHYAEPHATDFHRDIVEDWKVESSLGTLHPRSAALGEIDRALDRWQQEGRLDPSRLELNERQLRDVLRAIDRWRNVKQGQPSARSEAVDRLQASIQRELDSVVARRASGTGPAEHALGLLDQTVGEETAPAHTGPPTHADPSAPLDLRPAASVAEEDVYPLIPATDLDWKQRVLEAALQSTGLYEWTRSGFDSEDGFKLFREWEGRTNDFVRWLRGEGPSLSFQSTMNCWEVFLHTAHWTGAVDRSWLEGIHDQAARAAIGVVYRAHRAGQSDRGALADALDQAYYGTLQQLMTAGDFARHDVDPLTGLTTPDIPPGHLVVFGDMNHVAMALGTRDAQGRQEVINNWNFPEREPGRPTTLPSGPGFLQRTTVEELQEVMALYDLPTTVTSAAPAWPVTRTDADPRNGVPVPVEEPGAKVERPASPDEWLDRRFDAPVAKVATERYDPKVNFLAGESGKGSAWETLIRVNVQRIQAENGTWVRVHVVTLPVKPMFGVTEADVRALQASLNRLYDKHVNRGYKLPQSGDQLFMAVKLAVAPDHGEAVEIRPGRTADAPDLELTRPDARHWGLRDFLVVLAHESSHAGGLPDENVDPESLFRRLATLTVVGSDGIRRMERRSAVKFDGLMAGGPFDPAQEMPARYLEIIESVVDATGVVRDHPLESSDAPAFAMVVTTEQSGAADTVAASSVYEVVGRPDDRPSHPAASAPGGSGLKRAADDEAGPEPSAKRTPGTETVEERGLTPGEGWSPPVRTGRITAAATEEERGQASSGPVANAYAFDPATVRLWTHRVLQAGLVSVGLYKWVPSSFDAKDGFQLATTTPRGTNDFAKWIRGEGPMPSARSAMNCWEALLLTAHRSGAVDKAWLEGIHQDATRVTAEVFRTQLAVVSPSRAMWEADYAYAEAFARSMLAGDLTTHQVDPRTGLITPEVPAGHLVVFGALAHVALALGTRDAQGRQEILSHWVFPEGEPGRPNLRQGTVPGFLQKTTVEELNRLFPPPGFRVVSALPAWTVARTGGGPRHGAAGSAEEPGAVAGRPASSHRPNTPARARRVRCRRSSRARPRTR
ncbi:hypothetical protein GCM10029978_061830 [Actinoallomurus acanthiterrae]